jgi:hypothetical protein
LIGWTAYRAWDGTRLALRLQCGVLRLDPRPERTGMQSPLKHRTSFSRWFRMRQPTPRRLRSPTHVHRTLVVIDADAAQDVTRANTPRREGAMMTASQLADPLATAMVQHFSDRFQGNVDAAAAGFRRQTTLLVEAETMLGGASLAPPI